MIHGNSLSPKMHALGLEGAAQPSAPLVANGTGVEGISSTVGRSARVLYDYDAADIKELSLIADEVIVKDNGENSIQFYFILKLC